MAWRINLILGGGETWEVPLFDFVVLLNDKMSLSLSTRFIWVKLIHERTTHIFNEFSILEIMKLKLTCHPWGTAFTRQDEGIGDLPTSLFR